MTDIERQKLRELCERATPGPWFHRNAFVTDRYGQQLDWLADAAERGCHYKVIIGRSLIHGGADDYAFIAAARTALPVLLDLTDAQAAKIVELEAENARLKEQHETSHEIAQKCFNQREAALYGLQEANVRIASLESERDTACNYAREVSKALTNIVGGGSEMFVGRMFKDTPNETYKVDLPYCEKRLRDRFSLAADRADEERRKRRAVESERDQLRKQVEGLKEFSKHKNWSLKFDGRTYEEDDNTDLWTVYEKYGSVSDPYWDVIGQGETPLDSILSAASALEQKEQE